MSKIKYILSDMDGVLIDAKEWHYEALNLALKDFGYDEITIEDHLANYDGLSTEQKLKKLIQLGRIKSEDVEKIGKNKQEYTMKIATNNLKPFKKHIETFKKLKEEGYKIAVCSNSIRSTVKTFIEKVGLMPFIDFYLSNQDVKNKKPSPEIYLEAMRKFNAKQEECLILEDNVNGLKSAYASGGNVLRIFSVKDVNYTNIKNKINHIEGKFKVNIVIPMAGNGSRFKEAGYKNEKPLIDVNGKAMIERVINNLKYPNARYILILKERHLKDSGFRNLIEKLLNYNDNENITYNVEFVVIDDKTTEGTVCTILQARELINSNKPLIIANCDQIVDINFSDFVDNSLFSDNDGAIMTFLEAEGSNKWSFAKTNEDGVVSEVKEKERISDRATVGIYMWESGIDFINSSIDMIARNERVNNEFYVCPTYNYLIARGKKIGFYDINVENMHGLGTPEDLEKYINLKKLY